MCVQFTVYCTVCRSDLGSEVGFEATGIIDGKLPTVGVWAKKADEVGIEPHPSTVVVTSFVCHLFCCRTSCQLMISQRV